MSDTPKSMDKIMALCKRRGFVYQASEIYGGINGFWDYGPLGAQLKKNLRDAWWEDIVMTGCRGQQGPGGEPVRIVPLDTCIIQNPKVWEASGHVGGFNDPMVDCKECKSRFRADHVWVVGYIDWGVLDDLANRLPEFPVDEMISAFKAGDAPRLEAVYREIRQLETLSDILQDELYRPKYFKSFVAGSFEEFVGNYEQLISLSKREAKAFKKPAIWWTGSLEMFRKEYGSRLPCPQCGAADTLTEPRQFNLMFKTTVGATGGESDIAYLRPETAQGIFINFRNVVDTTRIKVPFGIAQTGKSFRNEVTPRNFTFRSREFEQMECEFFCHESDARGWYEFWRDWRMKWWESLGLKGDFRPV